MSAPLPQLSDQGLSPIRVVESFDHTGVKSQTRIAGEQPLTIKIDDKELVTLMTIGAHPELLVLGYLRNQGIFDSPDQIASITVDWTKEVAHVVSRTGHGPDPDQSHASLTELARRRIQNHPLSPSILLQSDIYEIVQAVKSLNNTYRIAGSVHGCGLFAQSTPVMFIEDVGRHGATDAVAGKMWLEQIRGNDKIFYTTGRLTSEIVIKAALMEIPVLISRNGTTHMAINLAKELGISLISRAKSRHFVAINAPQLELDLTDESEKAEPVSHQA